MLPDGLDDGDPFEEDIVFDQAGLLGGAGKAGAGRAGLGPTLLVFVRTVFLCTAFLSVVGVRLLGVGDLKWIENALFFCISQVLKVVFYFTMISVMLFLPS